MKRPLTPTRYPATDSARLQNLTPAELRKLTPGQRARRLAILSATYDPKIIEYDIAAIYGSDDRDDLLAPVSAKDENLTMTLSGHWQVVGLSEFVHLPDPFGLQWVTAGFRLWGAPKPITCGLSHLLSLLAALHQRTFPNGDHRFFETVRIDWHTKTITVECGS